MSDPLNTVMEAFEGFKAAHNEKLNHLQEQVDSVEGILNRPGTSTDENQSTKPSRFAVTVDGKKIPIFGRNDKLASYFRVPTDDKNNDWNLGEFVKASMGMRSNAALESGASTVPGFLTNRIIDDIRAKNRLVEAGSLTLPIEGATSIARIDTDPVAYEHSEGVADINTSIPLFSPVVLDPKMLAVQIPLTVELVADSANLDSLLQAAISGAISKKLDVLGIAALLADANIPESSVGHDTTKYAGVIAAAGEAIAADQDWPKAIISNAADYVARIGQVAGDGHYLGAPPTMLETRDLFTSSMTADKALLGDFSKAVVLAMRQQMRLEVVRWQAPGSATHLLIAYMRGAFYTMQPKALFRQLTTP